MNTQQVACPHCRSPIANDGSLNLKRSVVVSGGYLSHLAIKKKAGEGGGGHGHVH